MSIIRKTSISVLTIMSLIVPTSLVGFSEVTQSNLTAVSQTTTTYTWEVASQMAIDQNFGFKATEVDKMKLGRTIDDLQKNVNTIVYSGFLTFTDKVDKADPLVDNMTLVRNNVTTTTENVTLQKEALRDTIKSLFVNIQKAEIQLSSLNEQVTLNNRLIEVDRKRLKIGLISKYDLEKNYNGYQKIERTRDSLKTTIDKLYVNLKNLMGLDAKASIKLDYTFINEMSVSLPSYDTGLTRIYAENQKIALYRNILKRAEEFRTGTNDRYGNSDTNFATADLDVDKAKITLDGAVTDLPYKYDAAYNLAMDAYANYNQKQKELDVKKLEYKNTILKLKLGSVSKLDNDVMAIQLKAMENDYNMLKLDYVLSRLSLESTIKGTNQ